MYKLFKICSPPYFPNRIDKISELLNFVKVGGGEGAAPQYPLATALLNSPYNFEYRNEVQINAPEWG